MMRCCTDGFPHRFPDLVGRGFESGQGDNRVETPGLLLKFGQRQGVAGRSGQKNQTQYRASGKTFPIHHEFKLVAQPAHSSENRETVEAPR